MTDKTPRPLGAPQDNTARRDEGAPDRAAPGRRRCHSAAKGRIAAAGIGIAAMVGLVANMQVADGQTKAAQPAPSPAQATRDTAKSARPGSAAAPGRVAAAKVKRPIVLTPHAVVNTVSAPSSGGSGYASGYSAPAAAPAAAPVASTSGSR